MAEIFRAKTFSTAGFEKLQVIKRILSHLSDNEEFVTMFIDEAKISVSLQHANLVQIYDFGKIRDNYFIAMEWVDGKDVKQILKKLAERRKLLPEEFAVFIAHEVCKGLDYAHKKTDLQGRPLGIVHRDMSPSNVLLSYSGEVKIADFGIAKAEMSQYDTKDGVLKGKFEYMSPEQARGDNVTQQSDLFSIGIILYEMLTGRRLFKTDSEIKTLEKIKAVDIKPPSALNPSIPARLDDIVMRALTRDPKDRFADAHEFQQALLEYMYPSTPPVIQRSLQMFLEQLFTQERSEERDRLEGGTKIALDLQQKRQEEEAKAASREWEEGPNSANSMRPQEPRRPSLVLIALLVLLVAGVGVVAMRSFRDTPAPQIVEVQVTPDTGALLIRIRPVAAKVYAGDRLLGEGSQVDVGKLTPGDMELRFVAPGYEEQVEKVTVVAAERLVLPVSLKPVAQAVPVVQQPPPANNNRPPPADTPTSKLRFESTPAGAQVTVDGKKVGRTPVTTDAKPGATLQVSYSLDGYETLAFSATAPDEAGATQSFPRTLSEKAAVLGKVNIALSATNRWADVYVDGKKAGQTPLFNHSLTVGKHSVRVLNESIGLDKTEQVTVSADEVARVVFSVD